MFERIALIVNPRSGSRRLRKKKRDFISGVVTGFAGECRVMETDGPGHATELARGAAHGGAEAVLAFGGDGTVNEVACGLVGGSCSLGIIPAGSGNGFARGLGIPLNPRRAFEMAMAARPVAIDVGSVDGEYFFNVFGLGFDAHLAARFHTRAGHVRGQLRYFTLGIGAFIDYRAPLVIVREGENAFEIRPFVLTVANGPQYGVGATVAPEARFADGLLDLVCIERLSVWRAAYELPRLFTGGAAAIAGRTHRQFREIELTVPPGTLVQFDGEVRSAIRPTLRVSVIPAALRVLAPPVP